MVVRLPGLGGKVLSAAPGSWGAGAAPCLRVRSGRSRTAGWGSGGRRGVVLVPVRRALAPSRPGRALWRRGVSLRATLFRACLCGMRGSAHQARGWATPTYERPPLRPPCAVEPCGFRVWRVETGCRYATGAAASECVTFPGTIRRFPGTRLREAETERTLKSC